MQVIKARNVHQALPEGLLALKTYGEVRDSRNGPVIVMPGPVTTLYLKPKERVLFHPDRDANPFFHFFESLWMLAGKNDVASVARYAKQMEKYSDDGKTLHGAYGHRWRRHFQDLNEDGFDQLPIIINALKENPEDRRQVLQMWDAQIDLGRTGKDIPCNTQAYFSRNGEGALDMTVCNRSNDVIWGAYGANAVHFSMLQEYIASAIGCEVGCYWQLSNNFHAYVDVYNKIEHLSDRAADGYSTVAHCPYMAEDVSPFPIMTVNREIWDQDLEMFLDEGVVMGLRDPFFRKVAQPILMAHKAYTEDSGHDRYLVPLEILAQCRASDWKLACEEWIQRRYKNFQGV